MSRYFGVPWFNIDGGRSTLRKKLQEDPIACAWLNNQVESL
jgi:hypothetical protein